MDINSNLNLTLILLAEATERHTSTATRLGAAQRDHTAAVNALNEAQKKFDDEVASIKKRAARDSDWAHQKGVAV